MQCNKQGWAVAVPEIFNATSVAELAQAIEARQLACSVNAVNATTLIPLARTEQWYLSTYQQCPQGQWASAVTLLPSGTALDAVNHWIIGFAHTDNLINRQLNLTQSAWHLQPPLAMDTLDSVVITQFVEDCATLEEVLAHVEHAKQTLTSDLCPLAYLSLYALNNGLTALAITAHQLLVGPHTWPAMLRSLGQGFHSCSTTMQTSPLHTLTLSHPSTLHKSLPMAAVQPLVDYAMMHTQSQYLDAVVLGCFAYAYNNIIMHVHLDVLHQASPREQTGSNGHCTVKSGLSIQANETLSLAHMVNVAKQVIYNLPSTSDISDDTSLTEGHGEASVLYHAVASASAHLAKQPLTPLLTSPFHSTFGYAKGYACEVTASISNDDLVLVVKNSPTQTIECTLLALMDAWSQALAQYQSTVLGTVGALNPYDYPLLSLDNTRLHILAHEV
ncbi:hypothetical protein H4R35_007485, partial [Dimargaris xerosporica]